MENSRNTYLLNNSRNIHLLIKTKNKNGGTLQEPEEYDFDLCIVVTISQENGRL